MITRSFNKEKGIKELYTATSISQEAGYRSVFMNWILTLMEQTFDKNI